MAKQIKLIKCPRCGSVQQTETKPDHFRCDSCGTEYSLEEDSINATVSHGSEKAKQENTLKFDPRTKKLFLIIAISVLAFPILISFIGGLFTMVGSRIGEQHHSPVRPPSRTYCSVWASTPVEIKGKAYIACFRRYSNLDNKDERAIDYCFYDVGQDTLVSKSSSLEGFTGKYESVFMRRLADGNCYLIVNSRFLYRLNKETMRFVDYTPVIQRHTAFGSGVAQIGFLDPRECGDALNVKSGVGYLYTYFPIIDSVYTYREARGNLSRRMDTLLPGARDSTIYAFDSELDRHLNRLPLQLVEITFKYNAGGPMSYNHITSYYSWKKTPSSMFNSDPGRIINCREIASMHSWFDAEVAYAGHEELLVSTRATDDTNSPRSICRVDIYSGNILWSTLAGELGYGPYDQSIRAGNRYVIKDRNYTYLILDVRGGKCLREINTRDLDNRLNQWPSK